MDRSQDDVADLYLAAFVEIPVSETVLPVIVAFGGEAERGSRGRRQLPRSREKVRVDVGLGYRHDLHILLFGFLKIHPDVPPGIDHSRLSGSLAPDKVTGLRQVIVVDTFEQHESLLSKPTLCLTVTRCYYPNIYMSIK